MNNQAALPVLPCTGLLWDVERLRARYKFLRKVTEAVRFELVYYPYWVLCQQGNLKGRWFKARPLEQYRAIDAVQGKNYRITTPPERYEEQPAPGSLLAEARLDEAEAARLGGEATLKEWNRKYNRPWRPRVALALDSTQAELLWKPYWLMTPEEQPEGDERRRMFVFDATTGLGGVAEFWHVVEYVWTCGKN